MTARTVDMTLTLPAGIEELNIESIVQVDGLTVEADYVYRSLSPQSSVSFTMEDHDGVEVWFLFRMWGPDGRFPPVVHGPYTVSDFPVVPVA